MQRRAALAFFLALTGCSGTSAPGIATYVDGGAPPPPTSPPAPAPPPPLTIIRVHYPAGAHSLALRGSAGTLSWSKGVPLSRVDAETFEWKSDARVEIEFKPLLDDVTWSRGPNHRVLPGKSVDVWPRFSATRGTVSRRWPAFRSTVLPSTRGVWVYLPPTYAENTTAHFPVVYMHDGQNLFDASTAFGGVEWKVDEAMDAGAEDGSIREAIVVGVENTPDRVNELTPTRDAEEGRGGKADEYLRMIADEIKPMVDRELRTRPAREDTFVAGSSLGGLVSAYASVRRADVFGSAGAFSPSTWWDSRMILGEVAGIPARATKPMRIYVDSGDSGPSADGAADTRDLAAAYRAAGYVDGFSLQYVVQKGASHEERFWAQRFPGAMSFLLRARE